MTELCLRIDLNCVCLTCKYTVPETTFITRLVLRYYFYASLGTRKLNILQVISYILNVEFECILHKVHR